MSCKNFRTALLLMLAAFACISIGGCGGSSSSLDNSNEDTAVNEPVVINNDLAEDEIPDVIEFEGVTEKSYANDSVIAGEIISIPSRIYLTRLNGVSSPDSFVVNLTEGTEYTVEISKGNFYQYPIGHNVPDIEIINPQGNELDFLDLGESFDVNSELILSEDVIELSVYPEENPYMICLTFTPSITGSYTINLCQTVSQDTIEDNITLFVYEELRNDEDNSAGYYKRYKFMDKEGNLSSTVNMNDIMVLRKAWNDAAESIIETWDIISDDETSTYEELEKVVSQTSAVQAYLDCLSMVKQYYGIFDDYKESDEYQEINSYETSDTDSFSESESGVTTAASGIRGTKIPAELYGIPYDRSKEIGKGFYAVTGAESQFQSVLGGSWVTLPVPRRKQLRALFKAGFISSQQDAEKFITTTSESAVQLGGFGFSAGYLDNSALKFGLTSTTFVIHYEETEPRYRMLEDDENYSLNPRAQYTLNNQGTDYFRYYYGDYFIGGYQYGTIYDAAVTITTKTIEQLDRVKTYLSAEFDSEAKAEKADAINKAKEFLKNNEAAVSVKIRTAGINGSGVVSTEDTDDMSRIAASLADFREKSKKLSVGNLSPIYVMLKRFRLLPAVFNKMKEEGDDGLIPISHEHSRKVMNFRRDLVSMHSYYNIVRDIANMDQSVKNSYRERYQKVLNAVHPPQYSKTYSLFNEENAEKMKTTHDDMLKLNSDLKDMGDRYAFYQLLMFAQDQEVKCNNENSLLNRPYGPSGGSIGYQTFMSSKAVQSDINAGSDSQDEKNTFAGSEWEPKFNAGSGYIFCYIKVTANNIHDRERKALPPNIGHQTADFFFKCGASRWLEWKINLRSMRFNSSLYPFTGLR